jgi:hypothetical protein
MHAIIERVGALADGESKPIYTENVKGDHLYRADAHADMQKIQILVQRQRVRRFAAVFFRFFQQFFPKTFPLEIQRKFARLEFFSHCLPASKVPKHGKSIHSNPSDG